MKTIQVWKVEGESSDGSYHLNEDEFQTEEEANYVRRVLETEFPENVYWVDSYELGRDSLYNESGYKVWLVGNEQRVEDVTGSCIPKIKVTTDGLPLPEGMSECIKGFIVKEKKPSPPPRPPMRKYKTSFFGFVDVLVNQDEIDAHRATMDKWREENLK